MAIRDKVNSCWLCGKHLRKMNEARDHLVDTHGFSEPHALEMVESQFQDVPHS